MLARDLLIHQKKVLSSTSWGEVISGPRPFLIEWLKTQNHFKEEIRVTKMCIVLALVGVGGGIKSLSHLVN